MSKLEELRRQRRRLDRELRDTMPGSAEEQAIREQLETVDAQLAVQTPPADDKGQGERRQAGSEQTEHRQSSAGRDYIEQVKGNVETGSDISTGDVGGDATIAGRDVNITYQGGYQQGIFPVSASGKPLH